MLASAARFTCAAVARFLSAHVATNRGGNGRASYFCLFAMANTAAKAATFAHVAGLANSGRLGSLSVRKDHGQTPYSLE